MPKGNGSLVSQEATAEMRAGRENENRSKRKIRSPAEITAECDKALALARAQSERDRLDRLAKAKATAAHTEVFRSVGKPSIETLANAAKRPQEWGSHMAPPTTEWGSHMAPPTTELNQRGFNSVGQGSRSLHQTKKPSDEQRQAIIQSRLNTTQTYVDPRKVAMGELMNNLRSNQFTEAKRVLRATPDIRDENNKSSLTRAILDGNHLSVSSLLNLMQAVAQENPQTKNVFDKVKFEALLSAFTDENPLLARVESQMAISALIKHTLEKPSHAGLPGVRATKDPYTGALVPNDYYKPEILGRSILMQLIRDGVNKTPSRTDPFKPLKKLIAALDQYPESSESMKQEALIYAKDRGELFCEVADALQQQVSGLSISSPTTSWSPLPPLPREAGKAPSPTRRAPPPPPRDGQPPAPVITRQFPMVPMSQHLENDRVTLRDPPPPPRPPTLQQIAHQQGRNGGGGTTR
jgi:hypothetical protein